MTPRDKNIITITALVLLAVVAAWGWLRTPTAARTVQPAFAYDTAARPAPAEPLSNQMDAVGQSYTAAPGGQPVAANGTYSYASSTPGPCVDQAMYVPPEVPAYASRGYVRTVRARPVTETRYVERSTALAPHYRERSKKKSALIVGGGAGAGAAIGALAGGGKGAAIGALTGGVGGFVYDRLTHRQRIR